MLRLIPTAAHTLDDVAYTLDAFSLLAAKLANREYQLEQVKQEA